jgi:hypothetical protein
VELHHRSPPRTTGTTPRLVVSRLPGHRGLRAAGEVGLATRVIWQGALEQAVRARAGVYRLELSAVTYVDIAGADDLVAAARRLEEGRLIELYRPPNPLSRVLDMFWPGLSGIEVSPS